MNGSLKGIIQSMGESGMPHLEVGIVESVSPVCIMLKSDAKIQLHAASLVIPKRISDRKKCLQNCYDINENGCKDCCVPKPMQVGEELYMLSLNGGKLYYVLDWK